MPRLSLTMKTGTVVQWFKKEGDTVQKGEPLVEVLSEKVTYDVEAPETGVLAKVLALEGMDVPVAQAIGIIAALGELISEVEVTQALASEETAPVEEEPRPEELVEELEERVAASPAAKR